MELKCKLIEKAFTDSDGISRKYYALEFNLIDGSTLEITVKGDKAKLLKLSNTLDSNKQMPDIDWLNYK